MFQYDPDIVYRDFVTLGVPASGPLNPSKDEIRRMFAERDAALQAGMAGGGVVFQTKAQADANLAYNANQIAWVVADTTAANNGIYQKQGASGSGSWLRVADLPYDIVFASNVGAGTADAVQATTSAPISTTAYRQLIALPFTDTNTGAMTVSLNGETARDLVTNTGAAIPAGYVQTGMVALVMIDGNGDYRFFSYGDAAAIQAAAEAAQSAAEDWAIRPEDDPVPVSSGGDGATTFSAFHWAEKAAAAAGSADVVQAYVPDDIASLSPGPSVPSINVLGYPMSPGARHDWVRSATEPTHPMKEQSLDGQWWEPSPFNIRAEHFGAWRRGQDVSATLQDAVDFALAMDGGAAIEMPPGDVYLEASIAGALGGVRRFITLRGQGYEATRLLLDTASGAGGIHFEQPTLDGTSSAGHFRNFAIIADGQGTFGVPALRWKRPEGGASHSRMLVVENLLVAGLNISTDYCGAGIDASGCHHPYFRNYQFTGPWGPGVPGGDYSNTSPIYAAEYGINMDGTYQGEILDSQIWACRFGIYNRSSAPTGGEGLHMSKCNIVQVRRGLWWERTGPEPSIWIDKCHINYRDVGLYIDGCRLGDITNNLIYQEDSTEQAPSLPIDVFMKNCYELQLTDNRHHFAGDTRRVAYQIDSTGTWHRNIEIIRPRFGENAAFQHLGFIGADATNIQIVDPNYYSGTFSGVLLGGTGPASIRYTQPKTTQLRRGTSAQSIPDGLGNAAAVSWNAEHDDDLGLWAAGQPTRITIPNRAGITRVRITACVQWDSSATGVRQIFIRKNGSSVEMAPSVQTPAGAGNDGQCVQSGWMPCTGTDYFEIVVGQTSGGPLNILNSLNTWCAVDVA